MPLIQCHLSKKLSPERKQRLIAGLVDATIRTLGADPNTITIVLHEHDAANVRELAFVPTGNSSPGS
ncbi:4-oxalocrotonate tautomerase family protein [Lysobacter sp. TAF61]|uniref:tautomerase family protein n=1 Tax=Lysobacter sp. TAF61 TaxID=3233072 RepID=UPI003F945EEC